MARFTALVTGEDRLANSDYAMTLDEIGIREGITRERVRQILNAALGKLKAQHLPELLHMRDMANELRRRSGATAHGVIR